MFQSSVTLQNYLTCGTGSYLTLSYTKNTGLFVSAESLWCTVEQHYGRMCYRELVCSELVCSFSACTNMRSLIIVCLCKMQAQQRTLVLPPQPYCHDLIWPHTRPNTKWFSSCFQTLFLSFSNTPIHSLSLFSAYSCQSSHSHRSDETELPLV